MRWWFALMAAALAGCTAPEPQAQISSTTRLDPALFAGAWQVVEGYAPTALDPCARGWLVAVNSGGLSCGGQIIARDLRGTGPGRLSATDGPLARDPIWVLWISEDHRTAAIGTPSRRYGYVLNKGTALREDRLQAARAVLEFNGYALSDLSAP